MAEMYADFENYFSQENLKSGDEFKYSKKLIARCLSQNLKLSCVCKFNNRFFRGEILNKVAVNGEFEYTVSLVDYGPKVNIVLADIFKPMEKYKNLERQAYKFKLSNEKV